MTTAEDAVRSYLEYLKDPESIRDVAAIAEAQQTADAAQDPIERAKALSAVRRLEAVDGSAVRAGFVANAKSWVESNDIVADVLSEMGVPNDAMREAGLVASKAPAAPSGRKRTRVSPDVVKAAVPSGSFSIADLEAASGASTATVRKVIAEMVDAGMLVDLGPDESHSGRGRAPLLFRSA